MGDISEDAPDDMEGLDASAAHVANLLSTEPADSMFHEIFLHLYLYCICLLQSCEEKYFNIG